MNAQLYISLILHVFIGNAYFLAIVTKVWSAGQMFDTHSLYLNIAFTNIKNPKDAPYRY